MKASQWKSKAVIALHHLNWTQEQICMATSLSQYKVEAILEADRECMDVEAMEYVRSEAHKEHQEWRRS